MAEAGSTAPPSPYPESPGEVPQKEAPWSPLRGTDALIGLGAILVGLMVSGGIVFALVKGEPAQTLVALVPQGILFLGVPIAIAASRVSSRPWRVVGFVPFKRSDLWLVAAGMGMQIAVSALFILFFFEPEQDTLVEDFEESTIAAIATALLVVIVAPITEETLFRGLFFGALRSHSSFWVAGVASGLLFGAVHLGQGDIAVGGLLAFFGLILAWLYERTGSLGPPIALHMLNNTIAFITLI